MKIISLSLVITILCIFGSQAHYRDEFEDNEFAEFDDFEDDDIEVQKIIQDKVKLKPGNIKVNVKNDVELDPINKEDIEDEVIVEVDEDSEFEHFQDEEEFEGFDNEKVGGKLDDKETPKITITKVPLHFRTNWNSYYLELLMLSGLIVYGLNFFTGRSKNNKIANTWFNAHKSLLEENFSLVGDDCKSENECPGLIKDSEHLYTLWCSGRTCCEGMLVELKFIKRQDLVALISQMIRPISDQIQIRIDMNKDDMDSFVLCLGQKKTVAKLVKELTDLSVFCPDKKSVDKFGLPSNFILHSEIPEASQSLFDIRVITILNKYHEMIDYIHFSDQYSGVKSPDDVNVTKLPETKKVLMFGFNLIINNCTVDEAILNMRPLLQLVFYMIDKVKRFKLTREAKNKADKNRVRVEEVFMKTTHAARAEAAAARREEKRRQEKERILQEDDPDKQRKWEDREMKRQMKKKAPKMKQLKI